MNMNNIMKTAKQQSETYRQGKYQQRERHVNIDSSYIHIYIYPCIYKQHIYENENINNT